MSGTTLTAEREPTRNRRAVIASIGIASVGSLAGCTGTSGGNSKLRNQLKTVEEATQKYTDHKKALQDGFKPVGPVVKGMGWHFAHQERVQSAAKNGFSLERPQVLTYDTKMNLGATEWAAPQKAITNTPDLFADENTDATEKWHPKKPATHILATPDDKQTEPENIPPQKLLTNSNWAEIQPPDPDLKPGDTVKLHWGSRKATQKSPREERTIDFVQTLPELTTLHAWVHTDNPNGVFAPVNPEFAQSGGSAHHH